MRAAAGTVPILKPHGNGEVSETTPNRRAAFSPDRDPVPLPQGRSESESALESGQRKFGFEFGLCQFGRPEKVIWQGYKHRSTPLG